MYCIVHEKGHVTEGFSDLGQEPWPRPIEVVNLNQVDDLIGAIIQTSLVRKYIYIYIYNSRECKVFQRSTIQCSDNRRQNGRVNLAMLDEIFGYEWSNKLMNNHRPHCRVQKLKSSCAVSSSRYHEIPRCCFSYVGHFATLRCLLSSGCCADWDWGECV